MKWGVGTRGGVGSTSSKGVGWANVETLSLPSNKLSGVLPAAWSTLSTLTDLSLKGNKLHGGLPDSWRLLGRLRSVRLDTNQLSGEIPSTLCNLILCMTTMQSVTAVLRASR